MTEQPCSKCEQPFPPVLLLEGVCNPCRFAEEQARIEDLKQFKAQKRERPPKEFTPSQEAARELARRELCRRHFLPFVHRFNPDYLAGWVHVDICKRLEKFEQDVAEKKSPRLMLFMPPRHGKSQLTSKCFPAWVLGRHAAWEFISCSYSSSLANRFSRTLRAIMRDERYQSVFKSRLDPDTQSVELWETTEGGGLLAAGVGGPITGSGAHILLIDDPIKNREEAESPTIREGIWDWYGSTAYTRLAPGGGVLLIQTRWHDDDLAGRLIRAMQDGTGDQWEVVEYPAIAIEDEEYRKAGEALHPARYDLTALERIRSVLSDRDWWALYQQKPINDEGAYFTRDMFDFYLPAQRPKDAELTFYDAWDFAIGQKDHNDWTVGLSAGLDRNGDLWLVARDRGKYDGSQLVEHIIDFHLERRSQITGVERGMIEMSIGPFLDRRISERKAWSLFVEPLKTRGRDKVARARAIQGMAKQGKVHLPHSSECDWVEDFMAELLRFPAGTHDDQVDAFAWLGQMIAEMSPASLPTPEKAASWKDRLEAFVTNGRQKSFMSA